MIETLANGYSHLRVITDIYHVNTNMTGFRWFQKCLGLCALDESIASALGGLSNTTIVRITAQL